MPRNLALCFDGTWNKPGEEDDGQPAPTNVCLLYQNLLPTDDPAQQLKYYHDGVGTGGDWFNRMTGGINGAGLTDNVVDGYRWLAQNFAPGDRIFLFGFSRGAFTARSVAGMIRKCGVLRPECVDQSAAALAIYQQRDNVDSAVAKNFRRDYARPAGNAANVQGVYFIGVWDTVGSLGIPLDAFKGIDNALCKFHDEKLSRYVNYAYHALAIDEHRKPFLPTLWRVHTGPDANPNQVAEQRWFCGAHSNVGGGYADHRLSDCGLQWMRDKAAGAGLNILPFVASADASEGVIRDSYKEFLGKLWWLLQFIKLKVLRTLTMGSNSNERLDPSVLARLRWPQGGYAPKNLMRHGKVDALTMFVGPS